MRRLSALAVLYKFCLMPEHFFYVAKNKHAAFYRSLVVLNIIGTVAIVLTCKPHSFKPFLREKLHVLREYLSMPHEAYTNKLESFDSFYGLFLNSVEVG